jgi:hypothetical protein
MALRRLADASHRVISLFTMSNSAVFFVPAARCCARVLYDLSRFSVGWVERQRYPSPVPPRGPGSMGFAHGAQPILRNSYSPFLRSRDIPAPGFFFPCPSFSAFLIPDRGDGGAPGGGILSPVAPVTTRHHVCEAWAVPRNRDGASRRSTVTVLGPLRARLRSVLRLVCAGDPCCRYRSRSSKGPEPPGNGFTTRPRTPPPAPPSGSSPETPLDERDFGLVA